MLSVAIHKDIAEYQPKVIGKLTGRTLISITVALGLSIAVAVYMNLVLKIDPTDVLYASNATICYGCVLTASVCATWIRRNKKLWSIFLQELLSDMSCRRNYSFCNGTFPKPAFRL